MPEPTHPHLDAETWSRAAGHAAQHIIRDYSSSFGLGSRLLPPRVRQDIAHLYAVVRIADEIVDGAAAEAGLSLEEIRAALDAYEEQVCAAPSRPFHTDPVLHAYAETARRCRFQEEHLRAFFRSMRMDIRSGPARFDEEQIRAYIYGSAEVIGLLCLAVFEASASDTPASEGTTTPTHAPSSRSGDTRSPEERATLEHGARALGAAFQKINFLRDVGKDYEHLGRMYLPGCGAYPPSEAAIHRWIAEIEEDLAAARAAIPLLPGPCQPAVWTVTHLFEQVAERLAQTPPDQLLGSRVRISAPGKLGIAARTLASAGARTLSRALTRSQANNLTRRRTEDD